MPPRTYSSVSAFLAHWLSLRQGGDDTPISRSPQDQELLADMEHVVKLLHPRERDALLSAAAQSDTVRRRERAELKLTHLLTAAGWLQG